MNATPNTLGGGAVNTASTPASSVYEIKTETKSAQVKIPKELLALTDCSKIPIHYFRDLLPPDVFDDYLYSDNPQTLLMLKQLLGQ